MRDTKDLAYNSLAFVTETRLDGALIWTSDGQETNIDHSRCKEHPPKAFGRCGGHSRITPPRAEVKSTCCSAST